MLKNLEVEGATAALTRGILQLLDALLNGPGGLTDAALQLLRFDGGERVLHPALLPAQPVGCCGPQVSEWLEVVGQLLQTVVLDRIRRLIIYSYISYILYCFAHGTHQKFAKILIHRKLATGYFRTHSE